MADGTNGITKQIQFIGMRNYISAISKKRTFKLIFPNYRACYCAIIKVNFVFINVGQHNKGPQTARHMFIGNQ